MVLPVLLLTSGLKLGAASLSSCEKKNVTMDKGFITSLASVALISSSVLPCDKSLKLYLENLYLETLLEVYINFTTLWIRKGAVHHQPWHHFLSLFSPHCSSVIAHAAWIKLAELKQTNPSVNIAEQYFSHFAPCKMLGSIPDHRVTQPLYGIFILSWVKETCPHS